MSKVYTLGFIIAFIWVHSSNAHDLRITINPENVGRVTGAGTYNPGDLPVLSAAANAGARFSHWSDETGKIIHYLEGFTFTMPDNDVVLMAHFIPKVYPFGSIDDFEDPFNLWWPPDGSGSTTGILAGTKENPLTYKAGETSIVNEHSGSKASMKLFITWDTSKAWDDTGVVPSHFVRHVFPTQHSNVEGRRFQKGEILESYVYGDNSGSRIRLMARDSLNQLEGSEWLTVDWTGWRRIIWDYNIQGNVYGWITGNNIMNGESGFYFDSYQVTRDKEGTVESTLLYFDDLRYFNPSFSTHTLTFNITTPNANDIITINNFSYPSGETVFTLFQGEYSYDIRRDNYRASGSFVLNNDLTINTTLFPYYSLTLNASAAEWATVSGAGEYKAGEEIAIRANAVSDHYAFLHWMIDNEILSDKATITYVMPAKAVTLTAIFVPTFELKLLKNHDLAADLSGAGRYKEGDKITVSAATKPGFAFISWNNEAGTSISTEPSFTYIMPADNVNLKALFVPLYQLNLKSNITASGTLQGNGIYKEGESITLTATPANNYDFLKWTDESGMTDISAEKSITYVMPAGNITLVAHFRLNVAVDNLEGFTFKVFPNPVTDKIHITSDAPIQHLQIIDLKGRVLLEQQVGGGNDITINPNLMNGYYFIRIVSVNSAVMKKILLQR
jgi:uncharacterized repeat protein (TIGR02543 family)